MRYNELNEFSIGNLVIWIIIAILGSWILYKIMKSAVRNGVSEALQNNARLFHTKTEPPVCEQHSNLSAGEDHLSQQNIEPSTQEVDKSAQRTRVEPGNNAGASPAKPIQIEDKLDTIGCPLCGAKQRAGRNLCYNCGVKFSEEEKS